MKILLLATTGRATRAGWQIFNSETNMKSMLNITIPTSLRAATLAVLALLAGACPALAATGNDTWQGGSGAANFSGSGNWISGSANKPPLSGDALFFSAVGANGSVLTDDQNGLTFAGITFNAGASAFTLVGNPFTLNGNITNNSTSLALINNNIALSAGTTIALTSGGGNVSIFGNISGGKALTLVGTGTLTLGGVNGSGVNGFTLGSGQQLNVNSSSVMSGTLTMTGGTVDNTFGGVNSLNDSVALNGDFAFGGTGAVTDNQALTMNANRTLTINGNGGGYFMVQGTIGGSYQLTKAGTGCLNVQGANTFSNLVVTTGVYAFNAEKTSAGSPLGYIPTAYVATNVLLNGGTIALVSSGAAISTNRGIALGINGGGIDVQATYTLTNNGIITGSGVLTKSGYGTLLLGGTNTYSAGTVISGGTVKLDFSQTNTLATGGSAANNILNPLSSLTIAGGNLALQGKAGTANNQTNSALNVSTAQGTITLTAGAGAGSSVSIALGNITRTGGGGLVDFSYAGATSNPTNFYNTTSPNGMIGGWATANSFNEWASVSNGVVWPLGVNGGYITIIPSGGGNATGNYQITSPSVSNITSSVAMNSLRLGSGSGLSLAGNNLTLNDTNGGLLCYGNAAVLSSGGYLTAGSGKELIIITKAGTTLTNNAPLVGAADTGRLTYGGAGTMLLSSANTFTGPTLVNGGTLALASGGSLTSPVKINTGATLVVSNGATIFTNVEVGPSTASGTVNFNNYGTVGTVTIDGAITPYTPGNVFAGYATAPGCYKVFNGSVTGIVTNNGILVLDAGVASSTAIGTVYSFNNLGSIQNNSTNNNLIVLGAGSQLGYLNLQANSVLTLAAANLAGPIGISWFGYNSAATNAQCTLSNGVWNVANFGQGNSAAQFTGTNTLIAGATVNCSQPGVTHGTYNVRNGTMNFLGALSEGGQGANQIGLNLNVPDTGAGPAAVNVIGGGLTFGLGTANTYPVQSGLFVANGGAVVINGNLQLTAGAYTNNFVETNTINLSGGKLVVLGQLLASSATATNLMNAAFTPLAPTNIFNWTGGQLTAGIINVSNGVWTAAVTNSSGTLQGSTVVSAIFGGNFTSSTLTQNAGTLAPGDVGYSGKTIITNGNYVLAAGGTLAIDLGGTTASTAFQDGTNSADYDNIAVTGSGNATLNGSLSVSLINGFTPVATNSFVILTNGGTLSGTFANLTAGRVTLANNTNASFQVLTTANQVILTNYILSATMTPATVRLESSSSPSVYGQSVTFTALVQTNGVTAGNATSNMVFYVDGSPVATNPVSSGAAIYATSGLAVGSRTIQAIYLGDANYTANTNSLTQTVNAATPVVTPVWAGGSTFTYNGIGQGPTLSSVATTPHSTGTTNVSYQGVSGTTYAASVSAPTNAGSYEVVVTINADTNNNAATATNAFVINAATPVVTPVWAGGSTFTYNGVGQGPTLSSVATTPHSTGTTNVSYQGVSGTTYAASVNAPTNTGSYEVVVTINADTNNNAATATNAFVINAATPVVASYIASYDFTDGVPFTLTASGTINQTYVTQRSTNLTDWVNIATNTADGNGTFNVSDSFSDLDGNAPSPLFYRLQSQLP